MSGLNTSSSLYAEELDCALLEELLLTGMFSILLCQSSLDPPVGLESSAHATKKKAANVKKIVVTMFFWLVMEIKIQ